MSPVLDGHWGTGVRPQYAMGTTTPNANTGVPSVDGMPAIVDGTPVRVVVLALSAAAGLTALKVAGFKFNIGVSA